MANSTHPEKHSPDRVDKAHLHDGKLIPKNLVAPIQEVLAGLPDGRYKKEFIQSALKEAGVEDPSKADFDIIKLDNKFYAVYLGKEHDKHLGKGAFGTVKLAQQLDTDEWLAVKLMSSSNVDENAFKREVENLKVAGLGVGGFYRESETKGPQYVVLMKYAEGIPLDKLIGDDSPIVLTQQQRLQIMTKLFESIKALHDKGLLHCDIKLDSFIYNPKSGEVQTIDLGSGMITSPTALTAAQDPPGETPAYSAPEMQRDENGNITYTEKTEVFALGKVAAQIVDLGRMDEDFIEVEVAKDKNDPLYKQNKIITNPAVREQTLDLLHKMTEADPDKRMGLSSAINQNKESQQLLSRPQAPRSQFFTQRGITRQPSDLKEGPTEERNLKIK